MYDHIPGLAGVYKFFLDTYNLIKVNNIFKSYTYDHIPGLAGVYKFFLDSYDLIINTFPV